MHTRKRRALLLVGIFCIGIAIVVPFYPMPKNAQESIDFSEYSSVNAICELATLKSYFHNVVMLEKEPNDTERFVNDILIWPFGKWAQIGHGQYWLEYSGIVETGIDASQIKMGSPNAQGVVDVSMPDAMVLNVYADEDSLTTPLSESGMFTEISGKAKMEAFAEAQKLMRQEAEKDTALLSKTKENAKTILEQFIVYTGQKTGKELTVNWTDAP